MYTVNAWLSKLLAQERSLEKLSRSICLGVFFALLPIIPFQTPLTVAVSALLRLNSIVAVSVLYIVNNPVTLIPIYIMNYRVGVWFFSGLLKIDFAASNPTWISSLTAYVNQYVSLETYLGTDHFCLWCLLGGGLICALTVSLLLYPLVRKLVSRVALHFDQWKVLS